MKPLTPEHKAACIAGFKQTAPARKQAGTWPDARDDELRALWNEGHSTAEIGRRMGISKGSIVGRSRRMNLPARPSPIRATPEGQVPRRDRPKRAPKVTLPPLPALPPAVRAALTPPLLAVQTAPLPAITAAPIATVSAPKHTPGSPVRRVTPMGSGVGRIPSCSPCQWPTTTANGRHRMLCESPADGRTSYCLKHQAESRRSSGMLAATQARLASAHG